MSFLRLGSPLLLILAGSTVAGPAAAALTSSEKAQIRDFVSGAKTDNANKVRSLVARTDLTPDESSGVLVDALSGLSFTPERGAFLKELLFGNASAPSRPVVALAIVKGAVGRADALFQKYPAIDKEKTAVQELIGLYGWLDTAIANAGKPTATEHDATAGIPTATYDECSKVLRAHVDRNPKWLKGQGQIPDGASRFRAQAQVALVDMLPDGVTRRVDGADRIGLTGARRTMLVDWGVLVADTGKIDEPKAERTRQILARLAGGRAEVELVFAADERAGAFQARGAIVDVAPSSERWPFIDEPAPATFDNVTSAIAHDLADRLASRLLAEKSDFRAQAERDAKAASGDLQRLLGRPRAPTVEHAIGAAVHALILDGPKSVDIAQKRYEGLRPETEALLSDALGVLAGGDPAKIAKIEVGRANAWAPLTVTKLLPSGPAIEFAFDTHKWVVERTPPGYGASVVRKDGTPLKQK